MQPNHESDEGNTYRAITGRIWSLALPIIGLNVLNVLALAVDTAMCGRLPNATDALTALSFATQVIFLLMVAMIGLTVGTVALVARAFGGGDHERVNHLLIQSTLLTLLLGLSIAIIGNLFAEQILYLLGATPSVCALGLQYLRPLLWSTPFFYLTIMLAAVLRGVGNTRLPFVIALFTNVLNAFLNYLFILGNLGFPALGIQGAAVGTITSYTLGAITHIVCLRTGVIESLYLSLKPKKIDGKLAASLIRIGTPAALDMVILNAALVSMVSMLGRIDSLAVAAHGVGLRVQALAFVPGMSISQATGALIGQALGAENVTKAKKTVHASIVLCSIVMSVLGLLIIMAAPSILRLFQIAPGTGLGQFAMTWMQLLGYGMPIVGIHIAFVGMMQGAGVTQTSLNINMSTTLLIQIPMSAILGFWAGWGAFGVWVAFPGTFAAKVALDLVVYYRGNWARVGAEAT